MSYITSFRLSLVMAAASMCLAAMAWAQSPATAPAEVKSISVESWEIQLPLGHLGVALGTVVRVTGEAFDGKLTERKADQGKILLKITTVNSQRLASPVVFDSPRMPTDVRQPVPGDQFDYYVHEYMASSQELSRRLKNWGSRRSRSPAMAFTIAATFGYTPRMLKRSDRAESSAAALSSI